MSVLPTETGVFSKDLADTQHFELTSQQGQGTESGLENNIAHDAAHDVDLRIETGSDVVTAKTWTVVVALSLSVGIAFWPVPYISTIQGAIAADLGNPIAGTWFTATYTAALTIAFMGCGPNSDLFGRRWFILGGNILAVIGAIVGGSARNTNIAIVAQALLGFAGGNCQLAAYALPELLPNKWRHWAVVTSDAAIIFTVLIGPVAARVAITHGGAWRWGYYGIAFAIALPGLTLFFLYFPPKHPRGIPLGRALRDLDYVGCLTFSAATALILSGIVYSQLLKSTDRIVIGTLMGGFASLIFFMLWETFARLEQPVAPTRLFIRDKGTALTAPFVVGFVVTMFYFGTNIIWPTMIATFFTTPTTPLAKSLKLATVPGFGVLTGALLLSFAGSQIKHWKWQLTGSVTLMTFFGALLALGNPEREALCVACLFLSSAAFAWAQYLSIAYIQFGADQVELGIAGGLAGVARAAGGSVAATIYETVLVNVQGNHAKVLVPAAAAAAGASTDTAEAVLAALPLGPSALAKVPGLTTAILDAAGAAFQQSYVAGLQTDWISIWRSVALTSLGFGGLGIIGCFFCQDIGRKMNNKIEIFLENDVQAEKNEFH